MDLSPEDALRLHVLLANQPQAIRIDESRLIVYGLSGEGEAKIQLNPTCRDERYVKHVKELISGHVLGSPGGYPVYLQRWTRMGQMKDDSLEHLLLLGEPEAIIAAVCAQGLTNELARRAWWAMEDAENARQMLKKQAVCEGTMGKILAEYLVEYLPFEVEPEKQIETVSLVLQADLLSDEQVSGLWRKANRKAPYYVGFLISRSGEIPDKTTPHNFLNDSIYRLAHEENSIAKLLVQVLDASGQSYMQTIYRILQKPSNQEVVSLTLDQIAVYFSSLREQTIDASLSELEQEAQIWLLASDEAQAIIKLNDSLQELLIAMRILSGLSYGVLRPAFRGTTAMGSLMRKKLSPILVELYPHLDCLTANPKKLH